MLCARFVGLVDWLFVICRVYSLYLICGLPVVLVFNFAGFGLVVVWWDCGLGLLYV